MNPLQPIKPTAERIHPMRMRKDCEQVLRILDCLEDPEIGPIGMEACVDQLKLAVKRLGEV